MPDFLRFLLLQMRILQMQFLCIKALQLNNFVFWTKQAIWKSLFGLFKETKWLICQSRQKNISESIG